MSTNVIQEVRHQCIHGDKQAHLTNPWQAYIKVTAKVGPEDTYTYSVKAMILASVQMKLW